MEFVFETAPDAEATAALARRAFGHDDENLTAERFAWSYRSGYGEVIVLAALKDGVKVGQGVFLLQRFNRAGHPAMAAQFVDLFVDPDHRGGAIVMGLYKRLLDRARQTGVDLIFATPNAVARELNRKLMGLSDIVEIPYRLGVVIPMASGRVRTVAFSGLENLEKMVSPYCQPMPGTSIAWNSDDLLRRLGHPNFAYSLHASEATLMIASPRSSRGISFVLVAGFLTRPSHICNASEMKSLLRSAAAYHRRPVFVYAGINDRLERLPGFKASSRVKAPVLVQGRVLTDLSMPFGFDRCELIDFDFA